MEEIEQPRHWWDDVAEHFYAWKARQTWEVQEELTLLEQIDLYAKDHQP